jgi:hypothetical protein
MKEWEEAIKPDILAGNRVIIVGHGNSLRTLIKYLDKLTGEYALEGPSW